MYDVETGKDRRVDLASQSYESAIQYANLFTGAASYAIPITLPSGPCQFTPSLEIYYNSDQGNSWVGRGWDISGLHRIERSTKYGIPLYFDPVPTDEWFSPQQFDRFDLYLNGKHYELLYDFNSKQFISNPHGHFKISYFSTWQGISRWQIFEKSGVKYTFEGMPAIGRSGYRFFPVSKVTDPNQNTVLYEYSEDLEESGEKNGAYYPKRVIYGPDLLNPQTKVGSSIHLQIVFDTEIRYASVGEPHPDDKDCQREEISNYKGGSKMIMKRRISAISLQRVQMVKGRETTQPIQKYWLKYVSGFRNNQSLLSEILIEGSGGPTTEPLRYKFTYQGQNPNEEGFEEILHQSGLGQLPTKGVPNLWPLRSSRGSRGELYPGVRWVDINGDGLADMVWGLKNMNQIWGHACRVGGISITKQPLDWKPIERATIEYKKNLDPNATIDTDYKGFPAPISRWPNKAWGSTLYSGAYAGTELIDVNFDGFVDIVHSFDDGSTTRLSWINNNGKGWVLDSDWNLPDTLVTYRWSYSGKFGAAITHKVNNIKLVDVNGDGYPDIVSAINGTYLNKGISGKKGWEQNPSPIWKTPIDTFGIVHDAGVRYVDLNGDGLNDILVFGKDNEAWINTGHTQANGTVYVKDDRWKVPTNPYLQYMFKLGTDCHGRHLATQILDINGDGLPELVFTIQMPNGITIKAVCFNTANGWSDVYTGTWVKDMPVFAKVSQITDLELHSTFFEDNGVSFADFTGTGTPDIGQCRYVYKSKSKVDEFHFQEREVGIWINKFKPTLLTRIEPPHGGSIEFHYKSSHSDGAHLNHQDADGIHRMPTPKQIVSRIVQSDGISNQVETLFGYRGGVFDYTAREFRGFRTVLIQPGGQSNPECPSRRLIYTFFQDDARKGKIAKIRDGSVRVYSERFNIYRAKEVGEDFRGKAYETLIHSIYTLNYDYISPDQDLFLDLNFDVPNDDFHLRPCNTFTYEPWGVNASSEGKCLGGTTDKVFTGKPWKPNLWKLENYDTHPLGGHEFVGALYHNFSTRHFFPAVCVQLWIKPSFWNAAGVIIYMGSFSLILDKTQHLVGKIADLTIRSKGVVPAGKYTHVSFSYDGESNASLYINGHLDVESNDFIGMMCAAESVQIGSGNFFTAIDELKIFKNIVNIPRITKVNYEYDSHGNMSSVIECGDLGDATDDYIMRIDYEYKPSSYIMDKPKSIIITKTNAPDQSKIISATWYEYDRKGNLYKHIQWGGTKSAEGLPQKVSSKNPEVIFKYDKYGNINMVIDPLGRITKYHYNSTFPVYPDKIINPLGHQTAIEYYGIGKLVKDYEGFLGLFGQTKRIIDPNGSIVRIVYDGFGRIRAVYGPNDGDIENGDLYPSSLFRYSSYLMSSSAAKPKGNHLYKLNVLERKDRLDQDYRKTTFEVLFRDSLKHPDSWGETQAETIIKSINTKSDLFDLNYVSSGSFPGNFPKKGVSSHISSSITYFDGFLRKTESLTEGEGIDVGILGDIAKHDALGRVTEVYKPDFLITPQIYSLYQGLHKNLSLEAPYQVPTFAQPKTMIEYDELSRVIKVTNPDSSMTTIEYTPWETSIIDPNGHKKTYHLDVFGRVVKVQEFFGKYGEQAKQKHYMESIKHQQSFLWEKERHKNPAWLLKQRFKNTHKTKQDKITSARFIPMPIRTSYEYDVIGHLVKITDNENNQIRFEYDTLGRKVTMIDPDAGGTVGKCWKYEYDLAGNLIQVTDAKKQCIRYYYDDLNRIVKKRFLKSDKLEHLRDSSYDTQKPVIWEYDDKKLGGPFSTGHLVKMVDDTGSTQYVYDNENHLVKLIKTVQKVEYVTEYSYYAHDRLKSIIYPDGEVVNYSYGRDGNVKNVRLSDGSYIIKDALYYPQGSIGLLVYGNDVTSRYEYDDSPTGNQLLRRITTGTNITGKDKTSQSINLNLLSKPNSLLEPEAILSVGLCGIMFEKKEFVYDLKGNIIMIRDLFKPENTVEYDYDEIDRLILARLGGFCQQYKYDMLGNLLQMNDVVYRYEKQGCAGPHALTSLSNQDSRPNPVDISITYDANGNISELINPHGKDARYWYDYENHLIGISTNPELLDHTYAYDGDGIRVTKIGNPKKDSVIYPSPVYDIVNGEMIKYYYIPSGLVGPIRVAQKTTDGKYAFLHLDHLISLQFQTDRNHQCAGEIEYYPFGKIRKIDATDLLGRYKFSGKELDESGLYYFIARYYNPEIGRFITPDPLNLHLRGLGIGTSQSINPYAYVLNNPINYIDLLGLQAGGGTPRDPREYPQNQPLPPLGPDEYWDFSFEAELPPSSSSSLARDLSSVGEPLDAGVPSDASVRAGMLWPQQYRVSASSRQHKKQPPWIGDYPSYEWESVSESILRRAIARFGNDTERALDHFLFMRNKNRQLANDLNIRNAEHYFVGKYYSERYGFLPIAIGVIAGSFLKAIPGMRFIAKAGTEPATPPSVLELRMGLRGAWDADNGDILERIVFGILGR